MPSRKQPDKNGAPKSARCNQCGKKIRIPNGWTVGPAVRKHYWAKHRDRMVRGRGSS